jgi:hypothetical protein
MFQKANTNVSNDMRVEEPPKSKRFEDNHSGAPWWLFDAVMCGCEQWGLNQVPFYF